MKNFFASIGRFFKNLFSSHSLSAEGAALAAATAVVADASSGNIPAAIAEGAQVVSDLKDIKVETTPATPSQPATK